MGTILRLLLTWVCVASLGVTGWAASVIDDFSDAASTTFSPWNGAWSSGGVDQYTQGSGFISIAPVSGGDPTGDGDFDGIVAGGTQNFSSGFGSVQLTLRLDSGNTATSFIVRLRDSSFNVAATASFTAASFSIGSFTAVTQAWSVGGGGSLTDITYYTFGGDNLNPSAVRVSVGEIAVIPEPSVGALLLLGAGLAGVRRRPRMAL